MKRTATAAFATLFATQLWAQDHVFDNDVIAQGRLCVGSTCANGEGFGGVQAEGYVKLKGTSPSILFDDTSIFPAPDTIWQLRAGDGIDDGFFLENDSNSTRPFFISGDAPSHSLFVATGGNVGLGTRFPYRDLHIRQLDTPGIRFDQVGQGAYQPYQWEVYANDLGFSVVDFTQEDTPFFVTAGAPDDALHVEGNGNIGVGTDMPEGILHTKADGVQLAYFESGDGGPVQVRFRTDSQNRRFLAVNNANEVKSQIIFKDNEIQFTGATDSGANRWLTIGPAGIVSQGPTCNPGPCDRTFDRDFFTVPPIAERAAQMWENQHLPAIGPTEPYAPINLTEKMGGVIHELEVAHIYIEELHAEIASLKQSHAKRIAALEAKFDRLERAD